MPTTIHLRFGYMRKHIVFPAVCHASSVYVRGQKAGSPSFVVMTSATVEHAEAEQIKMATAVHLPLDELESGDLSFRLAVAP
jgi:hypothetical protein